MARFDSTNGGFQHFDFNLESSIMYPDIAKRRLIYLYSKILNQRKSYHQEKANQASFQKDSSL